MKRHSTWAVATLLVLAAACATSSTAQPIAGGTVTVRLTGDWRHFDPQNPTQVGSQQASAVTSMLYDSLIQVRPDGKVVPYLAKSWEQTPRSIKFTLRDDATCTDGTKVTPTVVKNSWQRRLKVPGTAANIGPGPYSLSADDATGTFTWTTQTPFPDAVFQFNSAIVCPAGLANPDGLLTTPQGSGPYVLDETVQGDHVTLKLRPDWSWGPEGLTAKSPGIPERIVFKVITNDTTAANLLLTGGLDVAIIAGADVDRLLANKGLTHKTAIGPATFPLIFNESPDRPTGDPKVREALMSAIDRNAWNRVVYEGRGLTSPSFLAPAANCYDASVAQYLPKDTSPEKAKQILTAAGWSLVNGKFQKNGKTLAVELLASGSTLGNGWEYLSTVWDSAGITVKTDLITDFSAWVQNLTQSNFDVTIPQTSSTAPSPSATVFFIGAVPPKGYNFSKTVNPEADREFALAQSTVGAERCQHWSNVQRLLLQGFDILPLAAPGVVSFGRAGLDWLPGIQTLDAHYFRRVK